MEAGNVLVNGDDAAVVSCPFCKKSKKISVAKYREQRKRILRIKCGCDKIFSLCLEYRRHPRKPVKLLGKSINLSNHRECHDIIINDISLGGVGFFPFKKHRTRKEDRLQLSFELNDFNKTSIAAHATVRTAGKDHIGCEFNATEIFKSTLGFYLLD